MNIFTEKLTEEERSWGLDQYPVLVNMISKGYNTYSPSALKSDFDGWKICSWIVCNKFIYFLLVLFVVAPIGIALGFIPIIIYVVIMYFTEKKYDKYKEALGLIKSGALDSYINSSMTNTNSEPLVKEMSSSPKDDVEAISKLFELLKMGAITQEEFDEKKQKILG